MERYDRRFFELQSDESLISAKVVLKQLFSFYHPDSIVDFGCGVGTWLAAAEGLKVGDLFGLDGAAAARDELRVDPALFRQADLSRPVDLDRRFDLAISLEVAEHLPPDTAPVFVQNLIRHTDMVLFSAGIPYQGGSAHINENWVEYWAALFEAEGWQGHDPLRAALWHDDRVAWWYRQNAVVFSCRGSAAAEALPPPERLRSLVHPQMLLRRVHEDKPGPLRRSLAADLTYQEAPQGPPPGYGPEYDYRVPPAITATTLAELRAIPRWTLPAPLADALAPLPQAATQILSPLPPLTHRPGVIGIGVQKAATTWLADLLDSHPGTFVAPGKEVNFFNRRTFTAGMAWSGDWAAARARHLCRSYVQHSPRIDPDWMQMLAGLLSFRPEADWYEAIWRRAGPGRIGADITPEYALLPRDQIAALLAAVPEVRVILLLRDPLDRIRSHVRFVLDAAPEAATFADDLALGQSVVRRSQYDRFVPDWIDLVPADRLLVARSEDIGRAPAAFARRLADFLSIDPEGFDPTVLEGRSHRSRSLDPLSPETVATLGRWLRPTTDWLERNFPRSVGDENGTGNEGGTGDEDGVPAERPAS